MWFLKSFTKQVLVVALALGVPIEGFAQDSKSPIPSRRIVLFQNTDLYGNDLENIFDVTQDYCISTCLANSQCKAFTYNKKSSACFPKSAFGDDSSFDGANSASVKETSPDILAQGLERAATLSFLPEGYVYGATKIARRNGSWYPTNFWTNEQLTKLSQEKEQAGDVRRAVQLALAAVNDVDSADGWIEVARLANKWKGKNRKHRNYKKEISAAAAINGYLRAEAKATQANALMELASALEMEKQGRMSIPVLRLAHTLAPRADINDAIDRAVSLFGFRISEHHVDQNSAQPRVCAEFSEKLVKAGVDYADFVKIPNAGYAIEVEGKQICVEGVNHGENLRLTFRKGLPAASGEVLHKSVDLNVYVPDRDPVARFAGRSYILPKHAAASIPLTTVNLDKVALTIYRVGDRNLLRSLQDGLLAQPLSRWDLSDLQRNLGQKIWTGTADVKRVLNREVATALPVGDAITTFEPGAYVMTAQDPNAKARAAFASQWFVVTDLGVSTMVGNDGLHVFTRSLGTAAPMGAVKVQLLARNNEVLGEAVTDTTGYAHFAPGLVRGTSGNAPAMVTVSTEAGDFAFLDQGAAEFDLSDRGVQGRKAPPPIDAFLATDRGAYRPGEQIHATLLARDSNTAAIRNLPLTLELQRPDGVLFSKRLVSDNGAGGGTATFDLPDNARRGTWKLRVFGDQKASALLERRVLVEDFVPERIDFDLAMQQASVQLDEPAIVKIDAKYLYGAPGGDLPVEGEIKLTAISELEGYKGYSFGRADEHFNTRYKSLSTGWHTRADGHLDLAMELPSIDAVSKPLEMEAVIRLREGSGRPVERRIKAQVDPSGPMIGIKPLFEGQAGENTLAEFDIVAVGEGMARVDLPRVSWVLNRIHTSYQWFQRYGDWDYEPITRRERIAVGEVALDANALAHISAAVEYGRYELKLISLDEPYTASSYQFSAGWYVTSSAGDTPDTLQVALDRPAYSVGDTAKLRIDARFGGVAQISVLSDRLIETRSVNISKGSNSIDMRVGANWGAGAYVTVSAIRPMDVAAGRNPSRALGLVYAKVDPAEKILSAHFLNGAVAAPRSKMTVRLKLDGVGAGQQAYATIAAVDLGVLNLTGFKTPAPDDHYFGQRKLGIAMRDVYGRLIDGLQGNVGKLRSGGDGGAQQRLNNAPPTEEVLAQFSGMVVADKNGEVTVDFDLPDFNGTVRLMAVVWSDKSVGHAEQDVLVRDPVVLVANAPRFLAPGDETEVRIELAHAFGPTGDFEVAVSTGNGLQSAGFNQVVRLGDKQRKTLVVPIVATQTGLQSFNIWVKTPDGKTLSKSIKLPVLHNDPEIARQTRLQLASGQSWLVDASVMAGMHAGTVRATLAVGPLAQFDAPGLLSALDRYPYGCTEQITSKALPLLYFDQLSSALGLANKATVTKRVNQAITAVLSNQASNGAFGLWRPDSGDLWLDAYVSDFLSRAKLQGYAVPDRAFKQALGNLRNRVNYASDFEDGGEDIAYALMILAREGNAAIGDLRYYSDTHANEFSTPLAQAQLGAALTSYGDQSRADKMFRLASQRILRPEVTKGWRDDYGSHLRDAAAMLTLAVDAGTQVVDRDALVRTITSAPIEHRSTQENLWSLLAANSLTQGQVLDGVSLNGAAMSGPLVRAFSEDALANGQNLSNNSGRDLTTVVTVFGVPSEPEPAGGRGYTIRREYFTMDGAPVTPANVALNSRMVTLLTITSLRSAEARLMVNDPLPAGFEIDNPNLIRGGETSALEWLSTWDDVEHSEFRTDRFLSAVNWGGKRTFSLAYIVRAVSPGRFHHPAASVEDMYRPEFRARTAAGTVAVSAN